MTRMSNLYISKIPCMFILEFIKHNNNNNNSNDNSFLISYFNPLDTNSIEGRKNVLLYMTNPIPTLKEW